MDKPVHSFTATAMRRGLQVWRSAVVPVVLARLGGGPSLLIVFLIVDIPLDVKQARMLR